jgi:hypothetical protein
VTGRQALAVLAVATAAGASSGAAAVQTSRGAAWLHRYDGPAHSLDYAEALAVGPSGARIFVTGMSQGPAGGLDYTTIAYDAATGARAWLRRYDGPKGSTDEAHAAAASPDGAEVFVTGHSLGSGTRDDYATVAYDAQTGAQLWASRYDGGGDVDEARAVGADGSKVFVTGRSRSSGAEFDYATVAYDAATGGQLWVARYHGPGHDEDDARALAASPDGSKVFVTGWSVGSNATEDYATIAYDAATGARLWVARYEGPGHGTDEAWAVGASPDGSKVFVTGQSVGTGLDYATVAYNAATGAQLWVTRYDGRGSYDDARALAPSPDGSKLFVSGSSGASDAGDDYATLAYDAATGAQLWARRYDSQGDDFDEAAALGVSPDGSAVYVTGQSQGTGGFFDFDYATVAYDAATGATSWLRRYDGPGHDRDVALALGVSPVGSRLFVTGPSVGAAGNQDYATLAYDG